MHRREIARTGRPPVLRPPPDDPMVREPSVRSPDISARRLRPCTRRSKRRHRRFHPPARVLELFPLTWNHLSSLACLPHFLTANRIHFAEKCSRGGRRQPRDNG